MSDTNAPDPKLAADDSDSGGCCGCFVFPVLFFALWALLFGVTIGGKHYGVSGCSFNKGLEIDR